MGKPMIPYGKQNISEADIAAVVEVLKSDFITQGPAVPRFENSLKNYVGAAHAVAMNSATSALHVACMALGLGAGDLLWTSPNSFVASANCGLYCGAEVDFVDVDARTYNMSADALAEKLARAPKLPKIVIPVHFAGQSCDMARIYELGQQYGFKIIEDASHAIGSGYRDKKVGSCEYSNICVFSFHPVKIITTAEGGMAMTNDTALAKKMQLLRSHGITRETGSSDGWYYEQVELGYNYRMTDIQAALGASQMLRLDEFVEKRHQIAKIYDSELAGLPLEIPFQNPESFSAYHLYPIVLHDRSARSAAFARLRENGVGVNVHYIPIHLQPYYQKFGFKKGDFSNAENYYAGAISLPVYYDLTEDDQAYVVAQLKQILV